MPSLHIQLHNYTCNDIVHVSCTALAILFREQYCTLVCVHIFSKWDIECTVGCIVQYMYVGRSNCHTNTHSICTCTGIHVLYTYTYTVRISDHSLSSSYNGTCSLLHCMYMYIIIKINKLCNSLLRYVSSTSSAAPSLPLPYFSNRLSRSITSSQVGQG